MSFPPKYRVSFTTPLQSAEVSSRLKVIVAENNSTTLATHYKFVGNVSNVHFRITLLRPLLYAYFTEVSGAIFEYPEKTKIHVTCRLPKWLYLSFIFSQLLLISGAAVCLLFFQISLLFGLLSVLLLMAAFSIWKVVDRNFLNASKIVKQELKSLFIEDGQ